MADSTGSSRHRFRTIWISDVHLGFRGCSAEFLLDFLRRTECKYLYLVGDIVDIWSMKRRVFWPQVHSDVIRTILGKAKHGTKVVFVPGNHDEMFRAYDGMVFGNLRICDREVHTKADGKRLLVLHGDQFDSVVRCSRALAILGNEAYSVLLRANLVVNAIRRRLGWPYWSLAGYLKHRVKNAVQYITNFEQAVVHEARRHGVDGVVCGHIHRAEIRGFDELLYCNCGDWVESCTALVEHHDGALEILHWSDQVTVEKHVKAAA